MARAPSAMIQTATGPNRTQASRGGNSPEEYQTGLDNLLLSDGTWNYSYDAEGNLTKKVSIATGQAWTYGYDHRNQLVEVERRTTDGGALEMHAEYMSRIKF